MVWKYVKQLETEENINDFECLVRYSFPEDFRKCVKNYNGGRPSKRAFDTDRRKDRELKSLLSFNKGDRETVWKIHDWNSNELADRYIAFAIDNFGNLICFDANNDKVVFLDLESSCFEKVADTFSAFLDCLYD